MMTAHLMPNGVFWRNDDGLFVDESHAFYDKLNNGIRPRHAVRFYAHHQRTNPPQI
ncbi:MAG: hypothetical protein Q3971_02395 [Moraxella sp.]|nr:hypothetical protein [Moraxella sp.]